MGMYDTVIIERNESEHFEAQVKCWSSGMHTYRLGDSVPEVNGKSTYIIALREGGFLYVIDGVLRNWKPELVHIIPIFDKWGDLYEGPQYNLGLLGEPYRREDTR